MWIRKTEEEIARERSRIWLSIKEPAVLFLICFFANLAVAMQGPRLRVSGRWPDTWHKMLFGSTIIAMIAAITGYALQILRRKKLSSLTKYGKVVICNACHRVKHRDNESDCECGGKFDEFDNWTWI